jgi:hypothetical protein
LPFILLEKTIYSLSISATIPQAAASVSDQITISISFFPLNIFIGLKIISCCNPYK